MSSEIVRTAARAMVADAGWPGPPFYETENLEPPADTLPPLWCSLGFEPYADEPIAAGPGPKEYDETGQILLRIFSRSGQGDTAALAAHETAKAAAFAWFSDPATRPPGFHVLQINPPGTFDAGGDGTWYTLDLEIEYSRKHQQG